MAEQTEAVILSAQPRFRAGAAVIRPSALFCADLAAILIAATAAFMSHSVIQSPPLLRAMERAGLYGANWSGWGTLLVLILFAVHLGAGGHYTRRLPFWLELKDIVIAATVALIADFLIRNIIFQVNYGFESALRWLLMVPVMLLARETVRLVLEQNGMWKLRTLVIGQGAAPQDVQAFLSAEPRLNYEVVATTGLELSPEHAEREILAEIEDSDCEFVIFALGSGDLRGERNAIAALDRLGVDYALAPSRGTNPLPMRGYTSHHYLTPGVVMLVPASRTGRVLRRMAKAFMDMVTATLLLILVAPVFLVIYLLVRADGGPALFGHQRIGANRRPFRCLKFRTMVINGDEVLQRFLQSDPQAKAEWECKRKLTRDPRITRIGGFLRRTSLDELPQLVNVLRGDMSMVGPRPIVEAEARHYGHDFTYYCNIKPGITGLWQVSGRSTTSYEERVRLDVWYVQNWSLWHDGAILLKTVSVVLARRGAV